MLEVFTVIFFDSWLYDRKAVSRIKSSSSCFRRPDIFQVFHHFFHCIKINMNKKLLAVFLTAMRFSPPEIHWRKEVINLSLQLWMTSGLEDAVHGISNEVLRLNRGAAWPQTIYEP